MDGLVLSLLPGCVTSAPKNITGSSKTLEGLNGDHTVYNTKKIY